MARRASLSTPYIAGENFGIGHPLYRWRRAYGTRHYRPVTIGVIGDSVAAGAGVSAGPVPSTALGGWNRTLTYKLQQKLNNSDGYFMASPLTPLNNNEYGVGGGGFLRTGITAFSGDPWTRVGSPVAVNRGIGMNSMGFNASNGSSTGTQYMEVTLRSWQSAIIWYESGVGSVAPGFTLYNGATILNDNVIMAVNTGLPANTRAVIGFDVNAATRGQYKLRIGRNGASGTAVVDAVYFIDGDANSGVRVFNYSWPGMVSGDFVANNTAANSSAAAISVYQPPELLIFYLGANDYGTNVNPSTYQTNMSNLIDKYRAAYAAKPPPCLLVAHWPRYDTLTPTFPWTQYRDALYAVARSKTETWEGQTLPYVDVLDVGPHFPSSAALDTASEALVVPNPTSGWGVHPTDRGHSWLASLIADKLMQSTAV